MIFLWLIALVAAAPAADSKASAPITVVHIVADDLGRQDLGYFNDGKTVSPHINERSRQVIIPGRRR